MKVIRPAFWKNFQCLGGRCTDNCCIGWEIIVDRKTVKRYQRVPGELGRKLKQSMQVQDGETSFKMKENRCPFLNRENLCDLILELGEDSLCEICREHPRFYAWFGEWKEAGLGLCCEEAVRLLLAEEKPLLFETVWEEGEETYYDVESPWISRLVEVRGLIFRNLQDRGKPIYDRMKEVLALAEQVQECLDREDEEQLRQRMEKAALKLEKRADVSELNERMEKTAWPQWKQACENLLDVFLGMEAMDEGWLLRLQNIRENLEKYYVNLEKYLLCEAKWEYEWEHLMVYSVFRYFLKGAEEEEILSRVRMAVAGCSLMRLLHMETWDKNQKLSRRDRICNIKAYSKELEYSPENLEKLLDAVWEDEIGGKDNLCCLWRAGVNDGNASP